MRQSALLTMALWLVKDNTAAYDVVPYILYTFAELCHRTGRAEEARMRFPPGAATAS